MKKLLARIFALISLVSFGQNPPLEEKTDSSLSINWGPTVKVKTPGTLRNFMGAIDGKYYSYFENHDSWITDQNVEILDVSAGVQKLISSKQRYDSDYPQFKTFLIIDKKIKLLASRFIKEEDKLMLNLYDLNEETGELSNETFISGFGSPKQDYGTFVVLRSEDNSKIGIFTIPPFVEGEKARIRLKNFNNNMELIYKKDIEFRNGNFGNYLVDFKIENDGTMEALFIGKNGIGNDSVNYELIACIAPVEEEPFVIHKILPKKQVKDLRINKLPNGTFSILGMNTAKKSMNKSLIAGTLDPQSKVISDFTYTRFPKSYFLSFEESNVQKDVEKNYREDSKDDIFESFSLRKVLVNADGSQYLVLEESSIRAATRNSPRKAYFLDILVAKFNSTNELEWVRKVPKDQESKSQIVEYNCSFYAFLSNGDVCLLYNDNPENYPIPEDNAFATFKENDRDGNIILHRITPNGRQTWTVVQGDNNEEGLRFNVTNVQRIEKGKLLVRRSKGSDMSFGLFEFNE